MILIKLETRNINSNTRLSFERRVLKSRFRLFSEEMYINFLKTIYLIVSIMRCMTSK